MNPRGDWIMGFLPCTIISANWMYFNLLSASVSQLASGPLTPGWAVGSYLGTLNWINVVKRAMVLAHVLGHDSRFGPSIYDGLGRYARYGRLRLRGERLRDRDGKVN